MAQAKARIWLICSKFARQRHACHLFAVSILQDCLSWSTAAWRSAVTQIDSVFLFFCTTKKMNLEIRMRRGWSSGSFKVIFRRLLPKSETTFLKQNWILVHKCSVRFPGHGAEQAENNPRLLESGPQNLDFLEQCEKFDRLRGFPSKFETSFLNQRLILLHTWGLRFLWQPAQQNGTSSKRLLLHPSKVDSFVGEVTLENLTCVIAKRCVMLLVYRGTSLMRNNHPPRTTIGP